MSGSSFTNWQMTIDGKTQQPGSYPAIDVGNGNSADFKVTIQNPPGQNITFASFLVPAENKDIHKVDGINTSILTFKDHNWNKGPVPYEILFTGAAKLDRLHRPRPPGEDKQRASHRLPMRSTLSSIVNG